jgi:hypothetical protein
LVSAILHYVRRGAARPVIYACEPPAGREPFSIEYDCRVVEIADARNRATPASLGDAGFELVRMDSGLADEHLGGEKRADYLEVVAQLVKEKTKAFFVHAFSGTIRSAENSGKPGCVATAPVHFVHNDYSAMSAPRRVRQLLPERAEELLQRPFAVINAWKPLHAPIEEQPLAVCDARTIAESDLVRVTLELSDRTGEILSANYRSAHHWSYYAHMQPTELLLMKLYESGHDAPLLTLHSAFRDPNSPTDAAPRQSIEVRTFAFF